jgi:hypothetical protein
MEKIYNFLKNYVNVYISTISFLSKVSSNCSNYSSKFAAIPMNFINLEEDLQPILWSLGQSMFTKIILTINNIFLN